MADKLKSVSTYIVLIFIVGFFAYLITSFGAELKDNPNADLSNSSIDYINGMTGGGKVAGLNTSTYGEDIGKASDLGGDDNKNDFSLDFSFGDKTGNKLERAVYVVFNIPEFILGDVFGLGGIMPQFIFDLMDWFLGIMVFIAIVLWIRKGE